MSSVGRILLVLLAAAQTTAVRIPLIDGLVLYEDVDAAAGRHVVMRVVDTKTGLDALAYEAQPAESALWSSAMPAVNAGRQVVTFGVTYAATSRRGADDEVVVCERIAKVATIHCSETPLSSWRRVLPGATRPQILQRAAAEPHKLRR